MEYFFETPPTVTVDGDRYDVWDVETPTPAPTPPVNWDTDYQEPPGGFQPPSLDWQLGSQGTIPPTPSDVTPTAPGDWQPPSDLVTGGGDAYSAGYTEPTPDQMQQFGDYLSKAIGDDPDLANVVADPENPKSLWIKDEKGELAPAGPEKTASFFDKIAGYARGGLDWVRGKVADVSGAPQDKSDKWTNALLLGALGAGASALVANMLAPDAPKLPTLQPPPPAPGAGALTGALGPRTGATGPGQAPVSIGGQQPPTLGQPPVAGGQPLPGGGQTPIPGQPPTLAPGGMTFDPAMGWVNPSTGQPVQFGQPQQPLGVAPGTLSRDPRFNWGQPGSQPTLAQPYQKPQDWDTRQRFGPIAGPPAMGGTMQIDPRTGAMRGVDQEGNQWASAGGEPFVGGLTGRAAQDRSPGIDQGGTGGADFARLALRNQSAPRTMGPGTNIPWGNEGRPDLIGLRDDPTFSQQQGQFGRPPSLADTRPPVDITQLGPGQSGADDLEAAFRNALATGRNVSDFLVGVSARELATMIEQYPYERRVRLQALQDITNQMGLAPGTEASYGLGNRMAGATEQTLSSAPGMGPMPGQYYDPIEQGLSSEIERSLAGNLPAAHLDREFREEEQQVRNQLLRAHGAGYETSTPGIEALQKMKESQQVRREQFRRETIGAFGGQQQSRRQFNIQQPEQTFQARTSLFSQDQLNRARFGEDVRRGKLNEYSGLVSGFGRYPTATTATQQNVMAPIANIMGIGSGAPERHQQLVNQQAMDAWKLENAEANQARANLGGVVGGIFGTAAGAVR